MCLANIRVPEIHRNSRCEIEISLYRLCLSLPSLRHIPCAFGLGPRSLPRMCISCLVCLRARRHTFLLCWLSIGLILHSSLKCLALCYVMYPSTFRYNALQGQCSNVRQFVDTILAPHLHCRPNKQLVQLRGSPYPNTTQLQ